MSCRLRDEQPEPKEERLREVTVNVQVNGTGQVPVRRLVGIDLGIASEHTVRVLDGAGNKVCAARCGACRRPVLYAGHGSEDGQEPPAPRPDQQRAGSWAVLANPEGNQFCVIRPKETLTPVRLALATARVALCRGSVSAGCASRMGSFPRV